jgi:hypothetical protein
MVTAKKEITNERKVAPENPGSNNLRGSQLPGLQSNIHPVIHFTFITNTLHFGTDM